MKNAESPKGNQPRSHALHPDWENTFGEHVDSGLQGIVVISCEFDKYDTDMDSLVILDFLI